MLLTQNACICSILEGVSVWNTWRDNNPTIFPDLYHARITRGKLNSINLSGADLRKSYMDQTDLCESDLRASNLSQSRYESCVFDRAKLNEANLRNGKIRSVSFVGADLSNADLRGVDIQDADFSNANLRGAIFRGAKISNSKFINADLRYATFQSCLLKLTDLHSANLQHSRWSHATVHLCSLNDCLVYGISAWDVKLKDTYQDALVITRPSIAPITVDNLQLAQTIFLFLENRNVRLAIDAFAGKSCLY